MNAAELLLLSKDVITLLETKNFITKVNGTFEFDETKFNNPALDLELVAGIEAALEKYGVHTPDRVAKIIQILPLVISLVK